MRFVRGGDSTNLCQETDYHARNSTYRTQRCVCLSKRLQWQGFVRWHRKQDVLYELTEILAAIRGFLMSIVVASFAATSPVMTWTSDQGWRKTT
ncbi:MAG TPA: hypothetical protein PLL36_03000 [Candidatus Hydrogenedentes bacterium]|nr:hypothetical protein [Candidatus Hydrogenedentota bacterium]